MRKLYKDHDRAVKTSCELGLHWARCDERRKPFQVLLNIERSASKMEQFDAQRRVIVPAAEGIFTSIMSKNSKFVEILKDVVRNRYNEVDLLAKEPPLQKYVKLLNHIESEVNKFCEVEE